MDAAVQGPEFTPPPEGGLLRSLAFAVVAHLLLLLALSVSVQWKREDTPITVEAEIWSPTVQQAAPKPVEAPPPPPPPPQVVEKPVVQPPPPAPPVPNEAEIALEREKARAAEEKAKQEEEERQRRLAAERKRQEDLARQEQLKQEQLKREQARQEQLKQEQAKAKVAEDRKREEQAKVRRQKQDEERLAKLHEENLRRMQGLAGATGLPSATGTATRSAGPSDSYAGRIRARVKPNIVFTDDVPGNPTTVVEVRLAPDGTIIGKRVTKASGVRSWDDAVLRALDRTEVLPRDVDGRVHTPMELVFRPRD
jgi:colicin import membrane protein